MPNPKLLDPLQLWRDAVNKLEGEVNTRATDGLKSQRIMRSLHQLTNISQGMERLFEKISAEHLRRLNLPSRTDVIALAESLRRIEEKVDRLVPAESTAVPRPARTRRPTLAAQAPAPASAQEANAAKAKRAGAPRKSRKSSR